METFKEYSILIESLDNPHPIKEIDESSVINSVGDKLYQVNKKVMEENGYSNPKFYALGNPREHGYLISYDKCKKTEIHHLDKDLNSTAEFENAPGNFKFVGAVYNLSKDLINQGRTVTIKTKHDAVEKYHRMAKLACRKHPFLVGDIKKHDSVSSFDIKKGAHGEIMEANFILTNQGNVLK